jgi:hypothetical protein
MRLGIYSVRCMGFPEVVSCNSATTCTNLRPEVDELDKTSLEYKEFTDLLAGTN